MPLEDPLAEGLGMIRIAQVAELDRRAAPGRGDPLGDPRRPLGIAAADDDGRSRSCERAGRRGTDAAASSRDERSTALEAEQVAEVPADASCVGRRILAHSLTFLLVGRDARRGAVRAVDGQPETAARLGGLRWIAMVPPSTLDELEPWARALLDAARIGHLGLLDDSGRPRVMPVTFAVVGAELWSAVDEKPKRRPAPELARVRWLRARPASALTVDRYDEDWTRLAWVQIVGTTTVVDVTGHADVLRALAARYPQYRDRRPPGPLLRLAPERILCWRASSSG